MTETQNYILNYYISEYDSIVSQIEEFSDYELNLVCNNLPDDIGELRDSVCLEIQWDILSTLCSPFIDNWDDFYLKYEGEIMDYCSNGAFIEYNDSNHSYEIAERTIRDVCLELISIAEEDYTLNEEVDFLEVIADLNRNYPVKFCEV